jgi:PAS domain S-box-containing protein
LDEDGKAVDYRFLEVNSAFERLTGLKAAKIIGRTAREILGKVEPEWLERYGKVALTGETDHFEEYSVSLGKYFEVRAFSVVKGQFAVTFEDVTKRKRAMEDLARMLIRIRHQQDAVALISRSKKTLSHKESFERITAIAGEALDVSRVSIWLGTLVGGSFECHDLFEREQNKHSSGMLFDVLQYPMYFKAIDSGHVIDAHDAFRDLRTLELATDYLKPEGIASALHVAIKVNGELSGLVCVEHKGRIRRWHMDETRFVQEIAGQIEILLLGEDRYVVLRRMESGLLFINALMDVIPQAVFYKDVEGRYQGCNAAFEKLMGISCAELVGKMSFEVFSSEYALICHVKDMELIRRGGSQSYEGSVQLSDGSDKNIIFDEVTYCGADGLLAGMIGVLTVRDI